MNVLELRKENTDLLKELKIDRGDFRKKAMTVQEAGKSIGFANATCHAIKTGLDIEKFAQVLSK